MSVSKRKRSVLDHESILQRTEQTAFQSAFFILDSIDEEDEAPPPKRRRCANELIAPTHVDAPLLTGNTSSPAPRVNAKERISDPRTSTTATSKPEATNSNKENMLEPNINSFGEDDTTSILHEEKKQQAREEATATAQDAFAKVAIRVQLLVAQHAPMDMNDLSQHYQDSFDERLDFKSLGYAKLRDFVMAIPLVEMRQSGSICILSLSSSMSTEVQAQEELVESNERSVHNNDACDTAAHSTVLVDIPSPANDDVCSGGRNMDQVEAIDSSKAPSQAAFVTMNQSSASVSIPHIQSNPDTKEVLFALDYDGNNDTSKHPSVPRKIDDLQAATALVKKRIELYMSRQTKCTKLCRLLRYYQEEYGETIDYKRLGFSKFLKFVESIDTVKVQKEGRKLYLYSSLGPSQHGAQLKSRKEDAFNQGILPLSLSTGVQLQEQTAETTETSLPNNDASDTVAHDTVLDAVAILADDDACSGGSNMDQVKAIDSKAPPSQAAFAVSNPTDIQANLDTKEVLFTLDYGANHDTFKCPAVPHSHCQRSRIDNRYEATARAKKRVEFLVSRQKRASLSCLRKDYKEEYGGPLVCQRLGYASLRKFLESIDSIEMQEVGNGLFLSLRRHRKQLISTKNTSKQDFKIKSESRDDGVASMVALNDLSTSDSVDSPFATVPDDSSDAIAHDATTENADKHVHDDASNESDIDQGALLNSKAPPVITMNQSGSVPIEHKVRERIEQLIVRRGPVKLSCLPELYKDAIDNILDVRSFGFSTLKSFIESVSSIKMSEADGNWILASSRHHRIWLIMQVSRVKHVWSMKHCFWYTIQVSRATGMALDAASVHLSRTKSRSVFYSWLPNMLHLT